MPDLYGTFTAVEQQVSTSLSNFTQQMRRLRLLHQLLLISVVLLVALTVWVVSPRHKDGVSELYTLFQKTQKTEKQQQPIYVLHLTDLHIEPWFVPNMTKLGLCRDQRCLAGEDKEGSTYCANAARNAATKVHLGPVKNLEVLSGCDPPLSFLQALLWAIKSGELASEDPTFRIQRPDIVMLTGDLVAHNVLNAKVADGIQRSVMTLLEEAFPGVPIVFVTGNNDLVPVNKYSKSELKRLLQILKLHEKHLGREEVKSSLTNRGEEYDLSLFTQLGCFSYENRHQKLTVVALNTGLLSSVYDNSALNKSADSLAEEQFVWLEKQLQKAEEMDHLVIIGGHTPPGIFFSEPDWAPERVPRYLHLVDKFAPIIALQIFGHHSKEMLRSLSHKAAAFVGGGITPTGGGVPGKVQKEAVNPSFKLIKMNPEEKKTEEIYTFFYDFLEADPSWRLMYTFTEAYGEEDASPASVYRAVEKIRRSSKYSSFYESAMTGFLLPRRREIVCDSLAVDRASLNACFHDNDE